MGTFLSASQPKHFTASSPICVSEFFLFLSFLARDTAHKIEKQLICTVIALLSFFLALKQYGTINCIQAIEQITTKKTAMKTRKDIKAKQDEQEQKEEKCVDDTYGSVGRLFVSKLY